MNKKLWLVILIIIVVLIMTGTYIRSAASITPVDPEPEIIFSIPLGENGINFKGNVNSDVPWGPPAMSIAPDGTFWIADTPENRLLHFSSKGVLIKKIDIGDYTVGAGDIVVTSKEIWVLDMASTPPKIARISLQGEIINLYNLLSGYFIQDGLSGIVIDNDGNILIEKEGSKNITQIISSEGTFNQKHLPGYMLNNKIYSVNTTNTGDHSSQRYILIGNKRVDVDFATEFGGLNILNINSDASFWVVIEEAILNPSVQVDQKVYHYDAIGNLIGMARVPIRDMYTYVAHGIAVGPDGNVYILKTKPDGADVQRLVFSTKLSQILTASQNRNDIAQANVVTNSPTTCRPRSSMIDTAKGYLNNSTYLDLYHVSASPTECPSRDRPRYLGGPGYYSSVPYAWGMGDSVKAFSTQMSQSGFFAGDYTDPNSGCGRGIDCSGLVSNSWALGDHYGTYTLETISTLLSSRDLLQSGDIMNFAGNPGHTILFDRFTSDKSGLYGYEATTYLSYDKVVYLSRTFSSIQSYVPRKYNSVCKDTYLPVTTKNIQTFSSIGPAMNPYPPPPTPYP